MIPIEKIKEPFDERRTSQRVPANLRCWLASDSITLLASTLNLSEGGALVTAPMRLPVGRIVDVAISANDTDISAQGQIVWTTASMSRGGAGLGLRFLSSSSPFDQYLRSCGK